MTEAVRDILRDALQRYEMLIQDLENDLNLTRQRASNVEERLNIRRAEAAEIRTALGMAKVVA